MKYAPALLASVVACLGVSAVVVAGCNAQTLAPVIETMMPSSASAGSGEALSATLKGRNFARSGNTVQFGPTRIENLASPDGVTLRFLVPTSRPAVGEVPPMVFPAGTYEVRVTTPAGTSNSVNFALDR